MKNPLYTLFLFICLLLLCLTLLFPADVDAFSVKPSIQSQKTFQQSEQQEVYLSFSYRNLFEKVVVAYYDNGHYFLPVSNIFDRLGISHKVNNGKLTIEGFYLDPNNTFRFDFQNHRVTLKNEGTFDFNASQMLVKELDFYVRMDILAQVFELNFSVDRSNLLLQLNTPNTLPIVEEQQRARRRERQQKATIQQNYHPLIFERDRHMLGGAFFDYSASSYITQDQNSYTYNFDLGTEIIGGDLQGSAFGSFVSSYSNFNTSNLRWRYVKRNNEYLTQFYAGQTRSDGLINRNFTGIRITNEPIEPRYMYDSYEVEGTAPIGSEVELYYNDALYDYTRLTENQQYRFLVPLTYGTSRLRLRIYGPDGRIRERKERIQVPFNFLPKKEFSYHFNAGRLDNSFIGTAQQSYMAQGDVAYGISNWLTQKLGIEYFNEFTDQTPLVYSSTSARILGDYLLNLDIAPTAFYKISSNVIYPSSASWGINYTYYSNDGIYNPIGNEQEFSANAFLPFNIDKHSFNFRINGTYAKNTNSNNLNYSADLNYRIGRLNLRVGYRDWQFGQFALDPSRNSRLSTSATYLISRQPNVPRYLQNTFISGLIQYNPGLGSFEETELQVSRSILDKGRIQASFARNFIGDFTSFNIGLTIDFNAFRSTSTVRSIRNQPSFTQNIRGSIGYDDYNNDIVFSNREQVGRSATSLRLFVDSNNSGNYDQGENVIKENAVRIGRAGSMTQSEKGILRFSQLQAYHRINMEINQSEIKNPMLVPKFDKFSVVTDPNQYKPINIPFYTSGVVSGKVVKKTNGNQIAQPGLRVYLESTDDSYVKEMRTFNDGTFYAYKIPPGNYHLYIDRKQLEFLDMISQPDTMDVKVEALAEGDFIEGLDFVLKPRSSHRPVVKQQADTTSKSVQDSLLYKIQLASFKTVEKAKQVAIEAANKLGGSFSIVLNTNTDLYAIRSLSVPKERKAIANITTFRNKYNRAALVIINNNIIKVNFQETFIQLRAFQNKQAAERFAAQAEKDLKRNTAISYNNEEKNYMVYISELFNSQQALKTAFSSIQKDSLYKTATLQSLNNQSLYFGEDKERAMQFSFQVRIEEKSGEISQQVLTSVIDPTSNAKYTHNSEGKVVYKGLTSWTKTKELQRKLEDIPEVKQLITVIVER